MNRVLSIAARLGLTALLVLGVAWGIVMLHPPGDDTPAVGVKESNADIFTMSFADRTSTQKFQAALDDLGHEKPRVFDYNGNTVMFSTNQLQGDLDQIFQMYMQAFADQGVNPEVFRRNADPNSPEGKRMIEAAVKGGVIPWVNRDDYMAMGGAVLDVGGVDNPEELDERLEQETADHAELLDRFDEAYKRCGGDMKRWEEVLRNPQPRPEILITPNQRKTVSTLCQSGKDGGVCINSLMKKQDNDRRHRAMAQLIDEQPDLRECGPLRDAVSAFAGYRYDDFTRRILAYRSIEAWYNKKTGVTKVTASWSDETFDATKAQPSRFGGPIDTPAAQKIPLCPGCRRTWAFQGTGREADYASNIIISPNDPVTTTQFYTTELQRQGWQIPESQIVVEEMDRLAGKQSRDRQWVRMQRGDEFLVLQIEKNEEGRTMVRTSVAP